MKTMLKKPNTINITFNVPDHAGRPHEVLVYTVPSKRLFSTTFLLIFTLQDFETTICEHLTAAAVDHITKLNDLCGHYVQGKGTIHWISVLFDHPIEDRTVCTL